MSDKTFGCLILFMLIVGLNLVSCNSKYAVVYKTDNIPCKPYSETERGFSSTEE